MVAAAFFLNDVPCFCQAQQRAQLIHTVSPIDFREQVVVPDNRVWPIVLAKVEGTPEVPDRSMKCIKVKVPEAHVGSDICIEGASNISRVGLESTLSRVREGHFNKVLVVNVLGAPITLENGSNISLCIVNDTQSIY